MRCIVCVIVSVYVVCVIVCMLCLARVDALDFSKGVGKS